MSQATRLCAPSFYLPLIFALGKLSDFQPGQVVLMDDAIKAVLDIMGMTPESHPEAWEPMAANHGQPKHRRWITWAWRNHQNKPSYEAKFNKGDPGTTCSLGRRQWALTPAGIELAETLRATYEPVIEPEVIEPCNWTSEWFTAELGSSNLYSRLTRHLTDKLSVSARAGRVDDHIQAFLADACEADAFKPHLEQGKSLSHRTVCRFATRHAYSTLRGDGQDALMRAMYGASTARDRETDANGDLVPRDPRSFSLPVDTQVISLGEDDQGGIQSYTGSDAVGSVLDVMDAASASVEDDLIEGIAIKESMAE